jgi:hypothetical protein
MGSERVDCDLCGLNRATLHLDEILEGSIQLTAHLCADCWYRLGIRVPLGNIWNHIQRAKQDMAPPTEKDPFKDIEDLLEESHELGDLLDPSPLAVAEPDSDEDGLDEDIKESLSSEEDRPRRGEDDIASLESLLKDVDETEEPRRGQPLGMPAVRVERVHPSLVNLLPLDLLIRSKAIPVKLDGAVLTVALADPFDKIAIANVEVYVENLGLRFAQAFADEREILEELNRHNEPPKRFESLS